MIEDKERGGNEDTWVDYCIWICGGLIVIAAVLLFSGVIH